MNLKLRAAREKAGKTQAQVAREANLRERTYQNYEYEEREPGVRAAIRIARVLNETVEVLFEKEVSDETLH